MMRKNNLILFIIAITAMLTTGQSSYGSTFIDETNFSQLNFKDQITVINNARDMATRIEHIQETQKHYSSTNKTYLKKYLELLSKTLIDSAYAQNNVSGNSLCLFAGWISIAVKDNNGIPRCKNPRLLTNKHLKTLGANQNFPKETIAMVKNTTEAHSKAKELLKLPGDDTVVVCAPHLYGYQSDGKTPFSFNHKRDKSYYNASMVCSSLVRKEYGDDNSEDAKKNYLKIIEENSLDNESSPLFSNFKVFYDVCACSGQNGLINKKYAQRMFPQRTCYSWLKQTHLILDNFKSSGSCSEMKKKDQNFDKFFSWFNKADNHIADIIDNSQGKNDYLEKMIDENSLSEQVLSKGKFKVKFGDKENEDAWKKYVISKKQEHQTTCNELFPPKNLQIDGKKELQGKEAKLTLTTVTFEGKEIKSPFQGFDKEWDTSSKSKGIEVTVERKQKQYDVTLTVSKDGVSATKKFTIDPLTEAKLACVVTKTTKDKDTFLNLSFSYTKANEDKVHSKQDFGSLMLEVPKDIKVENLSKELENNIRKYKIANLKPGQEITIPVSLKGIKGSCDFTNDDKKGANDDKNAKDWSIKAEKTKSEDLTETFKLTEIKVGDKIIEPDYKGYKIEWVHIIPKEEDTDDETKDTEEDADLADGTGTTTISEENDKKKDEEDKKVDEKEEEDKPELIEKLVGDTPEVEVAKKSIATKIRVTVTNNKKEKKSITLDVSAIGSDTDNENPTGANGNPLMQNPGAFRPHQIKSNALRGIR